MAAKQWFFLLLPLVIIISVFLIFLPPIKDPYQILDSAKIKLKETDSLYLEADIVMDLGIMGLVMRYISNTTLNIIGNESHMHTEIQRPFENNLIVNDKFVIDQGNYSCTNGFSIPVCYYDFEIVDFFDEGFDPNIYKSLEFLGVKKINNRPCDAVVANPNISLIQGVVSDFQVDDFSKITNASFYYCIDIETGLILESLWEIIGESDYAGYLVDTSINISKKVNKISFDTTETSFVLPYDVVSEEVYWELVNQSYEELSQDL